MARKAVSFKGVYKVLKDAVQVFMDENVMRLCGALSYATIFSLAPLMVVIISVISLVYGHEFVEGEVFATMEDVLGAEAAEMVQGLVRRSSLSGKDTWAAILGGVTLVFGASAVFAQIQGSLNSIWGIKPKPKSGIRKLLVNRLLSFSLVLSVGFLLIVSLSLDAVIAYWSGRVNAYFNNNFQWLFQILNMLVSLGILIVLFGYIFKVLPDARIRLKDVAVGAIVTAVLFMIGRFLISLYIHYSNFGDSFGASAALIIILVWIYYSSLILYFGACFTKVWAVEFGYKIYPDKYAVTTKVVEIEQDEAPLESVNKTTV